MMNLLFGFQGRINRARFWYVHIGVVIAQIVVFSLAGGAALLQGDPRAMANSASATGLMTSLLFIPIFWISIALAVKRYHDLGKSGWWIFIVFVPLIGAIWFLIEVGFLPGTRGPNQYGADPLAA
ncbi:MAG: DUF805 domain-containing protein [Rhodospirillales bacterium]|nr:DUF805 domain-containing protein [Rhodospirillales bacterium]